MGRHFNNLLLPCPEHPNTDRFLTAPPWLLITGANPEGFCGPLRSPTVSRIRTALLRLHDDPALVAPHHVLSSGAHYERDPLEGAQAVYLGLTLDPRRDAARRTVDVAGLPGQLGDPLTDALGRQNRAAEIP
jgi:hypothetical protein